MVLPDIHWQPSCATYYNDGSNGYKLSRQSKKLAKYTVVMDNRLLSQMAIAVMMHTLGATVCQQCRMGMNVNRRQQ
ncbi:MAG: hypothetical protein IJ614_04675 [Prevotella sp.]|nr:hypothetical protein [Prevotella sp.]